MTGRKAQTPTGHDQTGLPRPRRGARWRWSRPRQAMAAGGVLAAVLGLGVATGAGAATTTSGGSNAAAHGAPPGGMARPTVSGNITALSGDDVTVETNAKSSVTVVYSSSTTFKTDGGTTSSASALKVGAFIGVTGSKNGDGSVTATTIMIGRPAQVGNGRPGGPGGGSKGGKPPPGGGVPGA